jgi:DNA-binding NarL/FixJ family response regulator
VILVTAADEPAERRRLARLGVTGIVGKPFDPTRLASQIADCLGWSA